MQAGLLLIATDLCSQAGYWRAIDGLLAAYSRGLEERTVAVCHKPGDVPSRSGISTMTLLKQCLNNA